MLRPFIPPMRRDASDPFAMLQRNINRVFDETFRGWPSAADGEFARVVPSMDVKETDKAIEVSAELPGVEEKDLKVSYAGGILTIKGEKKSETEEKKGDYHLSERSYGSFLRSLTIDDVDAGKIEANFANGVLKVVLPKAPAPQSAAKTIAIKTSK